MELAQACRFSYLTHKYHIYLFYFTWYFCLSKGIIVHFSDIISFKLNFSSSNFATLIEYQWIKCTIVWVKIDMTLSASFFICTNIHKMKSIFYKCNMNFRHLLIFVCIFGWTLLCKWINQHFHIHLTMMEITNSI